MTIRAVTHQNYRTTLSPAGIAPTTDSQIYGMIPVGYTLFVQSLDITVVVTQGFFVHVTLGKDAYSVTSALSYAYEFGETLGHAIKNYLEVVIEQLVWLQKNEGNLSTSVYDELVRLQQYLRIM
ncbi:MAG: hypothetical protein ABI234_05010 [Ktedonobacteraceae bacterium]